MPFIRYLFYVLYQFSALYSNFEKQVKHNCELDFFFVHQPFFQQYGFKVRFHAAIGNQG